MFGIAPCIVLWLGLCLMYTYKSQISVKRIMRSIEQRSVYWNLISVLKAHVTVSQVWDHTVRAFIDPLLGPGNIRLQCNEGEHVGQWSYLTWHVDPSRLYAFLMDMYIWHVDDSGFVMPRNNEYLVAIKSRLHKFRDFIEDLLLRSCRPKYSVKAENLFLAIHFCLDWRPICQTLKCRIRMWLQTTEHTHLAGHKSSADIL